jgi:hypothetical protein
LCAKNLFSLFDLTDLRDKKIKKVTLFKVGGIKMIVHPILIILFKVGLIVLAVGAIAYFCACLFIVFKTNSIYFFPLSFNF